jgi:hypothetical protein
LLNSHCLLECSQLVVVFAEYELGGLLYPLVQRQTTDFLLGPVYLFLGETSRTQGLFADAPVQGLAEEYTLLTNGIGSRVFDLLNCCRLCFKLRILLIDIGLGSSKALSGQERVYLGMVTLNTL